MFDKKGKVNIGKFSLFVIVGVIGAYLLTYFINKAMPDVPIADYGIPLLTIIILLAGYITYRYAVADHKLTKNDFIGLLVFIAIVFVAVVYLPQWFPDWFSGDLAISRIIEQTDLLKSTMGLP